MACEQGVRLAGAGMEQENLSSRYCRPEMGDGARMAARGRTASGGHRERQSTDAGHRGGTARSSGEGPVMGLERRDVASCRRVPDEPAGGAACPCRPESPSVDQPRAGPEIPSRSAMCPISRLSAHIRCSARISWPGANLGGGRRWNIRDCPGGAAEFAELDQLNLLRPCWPWPGRPSGTVDGPLGVAACRLMWCQTHAMPGAER